MIIKKQRGVGLMEVLVALLLLAIGVLGYVALQLRAFDASAEAMQKSQAMVIMRALAENMRVNKTQINNYPVFVRSYSGFDATTPSPTNCFDSACSLNQVAQFDAYQTARNANQLGIHLTMDNCPGVTATMTMRRQCIYAFWGKTQPVIVTTGSGSSATTSADVSSCMGNDGVYVNGASCLMMEAY
ncbi:MULTISPECIES: type IV pilus modification protein PilV [Acinetobacter]|nr:MULTISPECIES: type IV pilus modification protein PilV [Acinetobacter]KXO84285.1 pilus assembly protein PilV [Acinetobacter venetianus]QNH51499.1 type IV pilus modification protein PilV [Acinetobacter venetianus]RZG79890.1 type IV pilus modification protein PilV [Acinetobacter venetianus]GAB01286.1 type 4 fimbrial biogenesis protein PilV [Acinetobacter sp. NBRC 100985]